VLLVEIAEGYNINANQAEDEWLIPTAIEFEGVTGRVEYPSGENGWYVDQIQIPFELDEPFREPAKLRMRFQVCSESACRAPEEDDLTMMFRSFVETKR
jgi:hypothetical protein